MRTFVYIIYSQISIVDWQIYFAKSDWWLSALTFWVNESLKTTYKFNIQLPLIADICSSQVKKTPYIESAELTQSLKREIQK